MELADLADAAGCSVAYVSRVFSHNPERKRGLTFARAYQFARYLGVSLDDLWEILGGSGGGSDTAGSKRAK